MRDHGLRAWVAAAAAGHDHDVAHPAVGKAHGKAAAEAFEAADDEEGRGVGDGHVVLQPADGHCYVCCRCTVADDDLADVLAAPEIGECLGDLGHRKRRNACDGSDMSSGDEFEDALHEPVGGG